MPIYAYDAVIDPDQAACPVVGLGVDGRAHASDWHSHRRGQLLFQAQGSMTLFLADRVGELAPLQAAWLPGGCAHRVTIPGGYAFRSLFFDERLSGPAGAACVLDVNPLLRELILRIVAWPADAPLDAAGRVSWTPCLTSSRRRRLGPCPCRCRPTAGCAPSRPNC